MKQPLQTPDRGIIATSTNLFSNSDEQDKDEEGSYMFTTPDVPPTSDTHATSPVYTLTAQGRKRRQLR